MKRRNKLYLIIFTVVVLITAFIVYTLISVQDNLTMLKTMEYGDLDLSEVADGNYYGEYSLFPVSVSLAVTVSNHKITDIAIFKHDNLKGKPAEAIINDVILNQSLDVDSVAGATYSSKIILLAIKNAIS